MLPYSLLLTQVKPRGPVGRYLSSTLENLMARLPQYHLNIGETYIVEQFQPSCTELKVES